MSKAMALVTSLLLKWIMRGLGVIWFVARGNSAGVLWFRRWWITFLIERVASVQRLGWLSFEFGFPLEFDLVGKRTHFIKGRVVL